jgi:hypothetical protein
MYESAHGLEVSVERLSVFGRKFQEFSGGQKQNYRED